MKVTRKDLAMASKTLSPEAVKVLRDFRRKSRGHLASLRKFKPIETVRVTVPLMPSHSGADYYMTVSLPRLKFLERA